MREKHTDPSKGLEDIKNERRRDDASEEQVHSPLPLMLPLELFTTRLGWAILAGVLVIVGLVRLILHFVR